MRRLSLAGSELAATDTRILDIAVKYGYDSQESFSRAFTRFHGVSPTQARGGANLKSFSRLSVKLILDGGNVMDYRIKTKDAFQIICKKISAFGKKELTTSEISEFWRQCGGDGTFQGLYKYITKNDAFNGCIVGASFGKDASDANFPYAIGVHYNGVPVMEEEFTIEEFRLILTQCSSVWEQCRKRSINYINRYTANSSLQASISLAAVLTLKRTRMLMCAIPAILVRYGLRWRKNNIVDGWPVL